MAYEERIYFIHNTIDWGSTFRVSLLDRDWPSASGSTEVSADSPVFTLRYNEQPSLIEPFMASAMTAFFKIDDNATLINELLSADDERFVLSLRIGLDEVWRGGVVPSSIIYEDDGQNVIPVTAGCGINRMQQFSFDPKGGAVNVRQLLNHYLGAEPMGSGATDEVGYSYAIPWQEASVNPLSEPVFDNLSINTNQFVDGDQKDPQPVTQSLFLENILKRFTARMYRWGSDEFKIESLDASNTAWGAVKSVNSKDWARGLSVSHLYPFVQAKLNYFHNTGLGGFDVPTAGFELDENGYDKTISYEALATDLLTVGGNVSARLDSIANYASSDVLKFDWRIETDNHYWNGSRWISGSGANTVTLVDSNNTTFRAGYFRSIADFSGHPDVDGITQLRFAVSAIYREFNTATGKAAATATRNFYDLTAEIDTETEAGATNRFTYANAANNATQTYDHGMLRLGDGFVEFTPNGMFPSNRTDFTFTESWTNNVHSTAEDIDNLTLRTIMGYQYGLRKMLRGTLQVPYEPTQTLVYEGKNYRFAGGTLDANGFWSGTWIEKRYEAPTLTFTRYNEGVVRSNPIDFGNAPEVTIPTEVAEVVGSVDFSYPKPRFDARPQVLISWQNIEVKLNDGTIFTPPDGSVSYDLKTDGALFDPVIFYFDATDNEIKSQFRTIWLATPAFLTETERYAKLFTVWQNENVDGIADPSAPLAYAKPADIAKALFSPTEADKEADIREIIAGFRANAVTKLGADVDGSVTELQTDASMPVRVDLPLGTRLLLVSGDETFELVTSAKVDAGAGTIPILESDITAYQGAKILFDNAFLQSQLLVQPSEVYIYAQSVDGNATSALNLATTNESAIATLSTDLNTVDGRATSALNLANTNDSAISSLESTLTTNGITGATNITGRVTTVEGDVDSLQANIVLTTDVNGNIAELDLSSNSVGSVIKLTGDQIVLSNNITKIGDANFEQQGAGWQYTSDNNLETGLNPVQNYVVWTPQRTVKKQGAFALHKRSNSPASVSYLLNRSRIPIRYTEYGAPNGANLIRRGTELTISAWIKTGASSQGKIGLALYDAPTLDANDNETAVNLNRWIGGTDIFANTDWTLVKLRVKFNGLTNNPSGVQAIQAWRNDDALPFFNTSTGASDVVYAKVVVQGFGTNFYVDDIQCTDLVDEVVIADGAITANKIQANAITANKIQANAITANKIQANAITANKIQTNAVTADKIAANSVTADKISANAITSREINATQIFAQTLVVNNGGVLKSANYSAGVDGWQIDSVGNAEFNNVTVRGNIGASSIEGDLTLTTTGKIQANSYTMSDAVAGTAGKSGIFIGYDNTDYKFAIGRDKKRIYYDGTDLIIGKGEIKEAVTFSATTGNIVTIEDAVDGTGGSAGVRINADGIFAGTAGQDTTNANVRITAGGDVFLKGEIEADTGTLGNLTVDGTLTLGTGAITSPNFQVASDGAITAIKGSIGGFSIGSDYIGSPTDAVRIQDLTGTGLGSVSVNNGNENHRLDNEGFSARKESGGLGNRMYAYYDFADDAWQAKLDVGETAGATGAGYGYWRGKFKSAAGSSGLNGTRTVLDGSAISQTVTIEDGIIVAWTV